MSGVSLSACMRSYASRINLCAPGRACDRRLLRVATAVLLTTAASLGCAEESLAVFRIDDVAGEIHLSDSASAPPGVTVTRVLGTIVGPAGEVKGGTEAGLPAKAEARFGSLISAAALAQQIDPNLLHALIEVESAYRPDAISTRGASGLMQLMPLTAKSYGVTDIFDPRQNIDAGARHLRWLLDRHGQNVGLALAAYNAGSAAVERASTHVSLWPNPETARYVERVLARYGTRVGQGDQARRHPPSSVNSAR